MLFFYNYIPSLGAGEMIFDDLEGEKVKNIKRHGEKRGREMIFRENIQALVKFDFIKVLDC